MYLRRQWVFSLFAISMNNMHACSTQSVLSKLSVEVVCIQTKL